MSGKKAVAVALNPKGVSALVPDRVLRMKEVTATVGLCQSMIFRLLEQGKFPRPIRLTERAIGWRLSDIVAWIDSRERITA